MKVVYTPLHARHDGGMEIHRGEFVPTFEMPARAEMIRAAVTAAGHEIVAPRDIPESRVLRVHDPAFIEFLRGAWARWEAEGREGCMLPAAFPRAACARTACRPASAAPWATTRSTRARRS
jgi:acetoin utilization deacetylase AcuC-like enzyme